MFNIHFLEYTFYSELWSKASEMYIMRTFHYFKTETSIDHCYLFSTDTIKCTKPGCEYIITVLPDKNYFSNEF